MSDNPVVDKTGGISLEHAKLLCTIESDFAIIMQGGKIFDIVSVEPMSNQTIQTIMNTLMLLATLKN